MRVFRNETGCKCATMFLLCCLFLFSICNSYAAGSYVALGSNSTATIKKISSSGNILYITFDFQNNSTEPTSLGYTFGINVYQKGHECDRSWTETGREWVKDVKDGARIQAVVAYELWDFKSLVEIRVQEFFALGRSPLIVFFNPKTQKFGGKEEVEEKTNPPKTPIPTATPTPTPTPTPMPAQTDNPVTAVKESVDSASRYDSKVYKYTVTKTLSEGKYKVGEEVSAGQHIIECLEASEVYTKYKEMMDGMASISGEMGGIFSFYGSLADNPTVKVQVLGSFGEEIDVFELKTGDSRKIILSEGETLKIEGNKCTCVLKSFYELSSSDFDEISDGLFSQNELSKIQWGMTEDEVINIMGVKGKENKKTDWGVTLSYQDQPIANFSETLTFAFRDNKLYAKVYHFDDIDGKKWNYLYSYLSERLGVADDSVDEFIAWYRKLSNSQFGDEEEAEYRDFFKNLEKKGIAANNWKKGGMSIFLYRSKESGKEQTSLFLFDKLTNMLNECEKEITFRGIPWGSDYDTVIKGIPNSKFRIDSWGSVQTLHELVSWFPEKNFKQWSDSTSNYYDYSPKFQVAGYNLKEINLYFVHRPDRNGKVDIGNPQKSLYAASYEISIAGLDFESVAEDLLKKLKANYGELYATDVVDSGNMLYSRFVHLHIWKGLNNTYVVLKDDYDHYSIVIYYLWGEGDNLLETSNRIINQEKEAQATPIPYNSDNTDGL